MRTDNREIYACIYYENAGILLINEKTGHISTYKHVTLDSKKIIEFSKNLKVEKKIFHYSWYKIKVITIWTNGKEMCKVYFIPILK